MPDCAKVATCTGIELFWVRADAPAMLIEELNHLSPDYREMRRYQHLHFVDGDAIYHHSTDLGPVIQRPGFILPAGGVELNGKIRSWYLVDELQNLAAEFRNADETEWEEMARTPEVDDFEALYHEERERREMAASRKGVNGPFFSKMR